MIPYFMQEMRKKPDAANPARFVAGKSYHLLQRIPDKSDG